MPPKFTESVLVLAGGTPPPRELFHALARRAAAVLCTDGAYHTSLALGIRPRWVVGDMDSLQGDLQSGTVFVYRDEPDRSDLEKALDFLASHGCPEACVLGVFGKRLDHSLSNLQVLESYSRRMTLVLFDGGQSGRIVSGRVRFAARPGDTISLFPVGKMRATTRGLLYPLKGELLEPGSRGVSNVVRSSPVTLTIRGRAWLVHGPPPPPARA